MVICTKEFVDRIRTQYIRDKFHKDVPLQRALVRSRDPKQVLEKASKLLTIDLDFIRDSRRIPKTIKDNRDILVYLVWQTCLLTNEETGQLFGMTYSAVSRILNSMRNRLKKEPDLLKKYNRIYAQFKM